MPLERQKTPYIVDVTLTYVLAHHYLVAIDTNGFNAHLTMINSDL